MKKTRVLSVLVVSVIALLPCSLFAQEKKEIETIVEIDGKEYLFWQGWHPNGNKWYEHYWRNNKQDGKQIYWAENGQKIREFFMENGYRHGANTEWHLNGKISEESHYRFCRLEGPYRSYYDNGQLQCSATYTMGIHLGEYTEWHRNGQIFIMASFNKDGHPEGVWQAWDEKGKLLQEIEFTDGKQTLRITPSRMPSIEGEYGAKDFSYVQGLGSGWHGYDILKVSSHGRAEYTYQTTSCGLWEGKESNYIKKGQMYIDVQWKKAVFILTDNEQEWLRLALKEADVFALRDRYIDKNIHDGTQWHFRLKLNGKIKAVYCSNKFPNELKTLSERVADRIISQHRFEILASTTLEKRTDDLEWLSTKKP